MSLQSRSSPQSYPADFSAPYKFTIFLGAFLLFVVQLVQAKYFLPWFGGAPAVWTTCMLFFQIMLLGGYGYAHWLANWVAPWKQGIVHVFLLLASLVILVGLAFEWPSPLTPDAAWKPLGVEQPIWDLIKLLAVSVGLPFFILSTTGPLLQAWFARGRPDETPYRLYAISNIASFLALLSYPFLVEPFLTLRLQARLWSLGFVGYVIGCGYCALQASRKAKLTLPRAADIENSEVCNAALPQSGEPSPGSYVTWLSFAACGSVMFLASTNQICLDIGVVPLLWILPLSLYLLSFVICFEKQNWYEPKVFHPAFGVAIFAVCYVLNGGAIRSIVAQVAVYSFVLFTACMVCHGELYRSKPGTRYLTSFYLTVALGGALGGIFVALCAPYLFRSLWEYEIGLWSAALLMFLGLMRDKGSWLYRSRFGMASVAVGAALLPACTSLGLRNKPSFSDLLPIAAVLFGAILLAYKSKSGFDSSRARVVPLYSGVALTVLAAVLFFISRGVLQNSVLVARNFYGVLIVRDLDIDQPEWRAHELIHGHVTHGFQYINADKRDLATGYYALSSGAGQALVALRERLPQSAHEGALRIGIVGLGVGTLASYGKRGDAIRFYEINPNVVRIAGDSRYFTYLQDCPAQFDVVLGDARLSMENELRRNDRQRFDLLAIDAFAGDAIPLHLLTKEAFEIYLQQINGLHGVLAIHISNSYLDLSPVLTDLAQHFGLGERQIHTKGDGKVVGESVWVLLSHDREFLDSLPTSKQSDGNKADRPPVRMWTDDYSSLFQVLKW